MFIGRTRWSIDDELVYATPVHAFDELVYHRVFLGSTPDDCGVLILYQKRHRH